MSGGEKRGAYRTVVGKYEGKRDLEDGRITYSIFYFIFCNIFFVNYNDHTCKHLNMLFLLSL